MMGDWYELWVCVMYTRDVWMLDTDGGYGGWIWMLDIYGWYEALLCMMGTGDGWCGCGMTMD